jgi:type IV pilus assembly protein PilB
MPCRGLHPEPVNSAAILDAYLMLQKKNPAGMSTIPLSGLARRLVRDGILTEAVAHEAFQAASREKLPFVRYVVNNNLAEPRRIAEAASDEFGTPLLDLKAFNIASIPKDIINPDLVSKHHSLPLFKRGNRLFVAVSDPTNLRALDEIKFNTGINTDAVLVEEDALTEAIATFLEAAESSVSALKGLDDAGLDNLDIESVDDAADKGGTDIEADETPIVRFVNKVLVDAIKSGASDIHFEPYEKLYRVRFRTDGILHEVTRPPINLQARIAARLKVMSSMDISERRVPQDGRIKMKLSKSRAIDFRVNTLPTLWGEKIVLRILDPSSAKMGIDALGYEPDQKELYLQALNYPQGMILVTGPTGSGKTVSLYTGLNILNTPERNISTAEDPVEINLEGINQVNVNPRVGLGFTEALRSFLRQDPDIIMVGEIRDLDTASIAIKAAQTGHMVMSTLHTNSAPETITRLLNMGVPPFNLATSLNLIIAQRLARRLCTSCAVPHDIPKEALLKEGFTEEDFADMKILKPVGCPKCKGGYKGRVGVYEVVKITPRIARTIMEGGNAIQIAEACRAEGFNDLRRSGLIKAKAGLTSLEEVNRITKD